MTSSDSDAADQIRRQALTLLAVAQNGLTFAGDPYDRQRYEQVRRCGEALMGLICESELEQLRAIVALDSGYMTPKVDARAGVFDSKAKVLLVQERSDGRWTLPGGWCDVLESPAEAIVREVQEEAGVNVSVDKLVAVLDRDKQGHRPHLPFHVYKLFFLCTEQSRVPPDPTETAAIDWFALDELPPLSTSRVLESQLRLMHTHWLNPALPTAFD
ncbi:NUDIX hydrolase N-terminal domain-containing protein [Mycobacterium sp. SP-6446]|uniref:NUDIX hydrolase n=2 Tax=unclassified Mycobacterium TaxID=2642494 RepID=UPI00096E28D0|nr:NUDIX hydrolase N-terminal domain-containing protein [Mycobacterium sp. SP-6446]OMC07984.1 NUDIX hydrolase [Mycobacterium sp. SP-6446]OMC56813.1 NUDIX hydrolase [Mycobacterium sp. IS-836]